MPRYHNINSNLILEALRGDKMTIYDIAKEAGVSASTVSRVVNGKPGVKDATREKVKHLLAQYKYSPNETARGLVNQASRMIGILISDIRTIHHTDGAYIIEQELVKLGYCCIIFNTGADEASKAGYIQILSQRKVEGAVMIGSAFQTAAVADAIEAYLPDVPVVIANGYLDLPNVYGVLADEKYGVSACVDMLVKKGHTKLAFIIDVHTVSNDLKLEGYKFGVERNGGEIVVRECEPSLHGAYDATSKLMAERPDIDGIIYAVDLLAAGGARALTDLNIPVPERVAIMGIDNSIYAEICNPRLSTLDNKLLELSTASVRNLIDALQGKPVTKKMMIFSDIVERETT